jgi:hypothetical protein
MGLHSNVLLNKDFSQPPRLELLDVAKFPLLCKDFVCEVSLARNVGWDLPEQLRDQRTVVLWQTREESGRACDESQYPQAAQRSSTVVLWQTREESGRA